MTTPAVWMPPATLAALEAEIAALEEKGSEATLAEKARVIELRALVRNADVTVKPDDGLVEPGMLVTIRFADGSTDTFLLGDRTVLADDRALSPRSPLGAAVNGRYVGDDVTYTAPTGPATVSVIAVEPAS
ncbi:GreA/GreB family elongation factor [Microbacterium sp. SSW1-49]|uniref:GreA/GreB family elongation factor n=1 Tax=Microbacterium croceum TaxID=2851645 RepID=A0ABT0FAN4_9MICO|nr:GreA/GreB family elongation factor [Microbacterium croceum]MCK2035073.1 GreA/GreB family elongation factor [Microbacterium croceum]